MSSDFQISLFFKCFSILQTHRITTKPKDRSSISKPQRGLQAAVPLWMWQSTSESGF